MKRSLMICKYCFAKRVFANKPKTDLQAAMTEMMLTWEPKKKEPWAPCYCRYEIDGFQEKKELPKQCPFKLEHVMELQKS